MKKAVVITIIAIVIVLILITIFLVMHKTSNFINPQNSAQETQISGLSNNDVNAVGQDVNSLNDSGFSDDSLDSLS